MYVYRKNINLMKFDFDGFAAPRGIKWTCSSTQLSMRGVSTSQSLSPFLLGSFGI